jgi:hypothetical protein
VVTRVGSGWGGGAKLDRIGLVRITSSESFIKYLFFMSLPVICFLIAGSSYIVVLG